MSTKQAAKYLGVSSRTIHRLIERGLIKASRFGNYWDIDRTSLEAYLVRIEGKAKQDPTKHAEKEAGIERLKPSVNQEQSNDSSPL